MTKRLVPVGLVADFSECCSHFLVLREIDDLFEAAEIGRVASGAPKKSGMRRQRFYEYVHGLDLTRWSDAEKLLHVFSDILTMLDERRILLGDDDLRVDERGFLAVQHDGLCRALRRSGFEVVDDFIARAQEPQSFKQLLDLASDLDLEGVSRQLYRLERAAESDVDLAIGTSKEVLETVCKTLLRERGVAIEKDWKFMQLQKATWSALGLLDSDVDEARRGADLIRQVLRGTASVANGINELRNVYGTGHGRDAASRGLGSRHARLVVGMMAAMTIFLIETHRDRT